MTTKLNAGQSSVIRIEAGKIATVKTDALGTGSAWFIRSGVEDRLSKSFGVDSNYQFGPYLQRSDLRIECKTGSLDVVTEFDAAPLPSEVARQMGTLPKAVDAATYTLSDDDHGYILLFAQACTVTVPKGLRSDFSAGWSQETSGAVTFAAAAGVTINSKGGGLASGAQYSIGGIAAFAQNVYRLTGV
jgi:hypothetical protein